MRQLVGSYFKNARWWTKCFSAGAQGGLVMVWLGNFSHSSGPFFPSPQSLFPLPSPNHVLLLSLEPPPMGLALLSPVLIGSLTNPKVPLSPLETKCVKLDVDFLHQEGREVADFPWGGVKVGVRGVGAKK